MPVFPVFAQPMVDQHTREGEGRGDDDPSLLWYDAPQFVLVGLDASTKNGNSYLMCFIVFSLNEARLHCCTVLKYCVVLLHTLG